MFTGIIEGPGCVEAIRPAGEGKRIAVSADFSLKGTRVGDSISVNGACLTAVSIAGNRFEADLSPETLERTTFGSVRTGERVNLERAMRLSDRLDGHLVSGHIDGIGRISAKTPSANAILITIAVPAELARYTIEKGSVAADGISLTINRRDAESFSISIIPLTARATTIGAKKVGDPVNIENDMVGKYIEHFLRERGVEEKRASGRSGIDMKFLAESGFL
jgi:riboflavin synthase